MRIILAFSLLLLTSCRQHRDQPSAPPTAPQPAPAPTAQPAPAPTAMTTQAPTSNVSGAAPCNFSIAECETRCAANDQVSCYRLGRLLGNDYFTTVDATRAAKLFAAACDARVGDACNAVAVDLRDESQDLARAASLFADACAMDSAKACVNGGALLSRYEAVRDVAKAQGLYARGCALDQPAFADACFELGGLLEARGSVDEAQHAFKKACDVGDKGACTRLAALTSTAPQPAPPAVLLQRAVVDCGLGDGDACFTVGWASEKGQGVALDLGAALAAYEKGCALRGLIACSRLAVGLADATSGFPVDLAKAGRASRVTCMTGLNHQDLSGVAFCSLYIEHLAKGDGMQADPAASSAFAVSLCEQMPPYGCLQAGSALIEGRAIPVDSPRGLGFLRAGCGGGDRAACRALEAQGADVGGLKAEAAEQQRDREVFFCESNGNAESCANVGFNLAEGRGGAADALSATKYLDRACKGGSQRGCALIVRLRDKLSVSDAFVAEAARRGCSLGEASLCSK